VKGEEGRGERRLREKWEAEGREINAGLGKREPGTATLPVWVRAEGHWQGARRLSRGGREGTEEKRARSVAGNRGRKRQMQLELQRRRERIQIEKGGGRDGKVGRNLPL
jgi:hypothetical protein